MAETQALVEQLNKFRFPSLGASIGYGNEIGSFSPSADGTEVILTLGAPQRRKTPDPEQAVAELRANLATRNLVDPNKTDGIRILEQGPNGLEGTRIAIPVSALNTAEIAQMAGRYDRWAAEDQQRKAAEETRKEQQKTQEQSSPATSEPTPTPQSPSTPKAPGLTRRLAGPLLTTVAGLALAVVIGKGIENASTPDVPKDMDPIASLMSKEERNKINTDKEKNSMSTWQRLSEMDFTTPDPAGWQEGRPSVLKNGQEVVGVIVRAGYESEKKSTYISLRPGTEVAIDLENKKVILTHPGTNKTTSVDIDNHIVHLSGPDGKPLTDNLVRFTGKYKPNMIEAQVVGEGSRMLEVPFTLIAPMESKCRVDAKDAAQAGTNLENISLSSVKREKLGESEVLVQSGGSYAGYLKQQQEEGVKSYDPFILEEAKTKEKKVEKQPVPAPKKEAEIQPDARKMNGIDEARKELATLLDHGRKADTLDPTATPSNSPTSHKGRG